MRPTFPVHLALFKFSAGVFGLASLLFVFLFLFSNFKARKEHGSIPLSLPRMGTKPQIFSVIRANFRGLVDSVALYRQGYSKFSKMDRIFVVPTWTKGPQIILPPSMGSWLASRLVSMLNAKECTFEITSLLHIYHTQFAYTVGHPEITSNNMIDILIKRELTRSVGTLNNELLEEIEGSMEDIFGTDGDVFVSSILHLFPKFLKPAVAWFATMPNRRHSGIAMKFLKPLIKERIENMRRKDADPTYAWEEPNDFITWMVRESFKRDTEDETSVYALAYRVVLLNLAGIIATTIMTTNALLDIWSAPNSSELIDALREEASRVLHEHNGEWTKAAIAKLHRLDSAVRESARVSGIGGTAMTRRVRAEKGITLPNGLVVPKNATVGVSMDGIHLDEAYYDHAHEFDAFRFSRSREDASDKSRASVNEDLVTTSVHWLAFSHGVHACPGRFFAANNIKMILAHLVLN